MKILDVLHILTWLTVCYVLSIYVNGISTESLQVVLLIAFFSTANPVNSHFRLVSGGSFPAVAMPTSTKQYSWPFWLWFHVKAHSISFPMIYYKIHLELALVPLRVCTSGWAPHHAAGSVPPAPRSALYCSSPLKAPWTTTQNHICTLGRLFTLKAILFVTTEYVWSHF